MKKLLCLPILGIFFSCCLGIEYSPEVQQAYDWSYKNGITTQDTIDKANMGGKITRAELAKMISNYAINILGNKIDSSKECNFNDVSHELDLKYGNGIIYACQLGLMGQNIENFRPNDGVTRAEFGTVLSRTLWGDKNEGGKSYYENHLNALKTEGIMNNISSPMNSEIRGYVMLMLMRSSGENTNNLLISNNTTMKNVNVKANSGTIESFPYATEEIKQQLAERIFEEKGEIPSDYFETANYLTMIGKLMREGYSIFGETAEQKVFRYYVMRLRLLIVLNTSSLSKDFSSEEKSYLGLYLDELAPIKYMDEHQKEGADLFASVIAYEEKFPYNPQKGIDDKREKILKMTKDDIVDEFGIRIPIKDLNKLSDEEFKKQVLQEMEDVSDDFPEVREKVLQAFKNDLDMLQSGKSRAEYIQEKNAENGIADYSFYLLAPELFPAELIFAEFVLDPENDDYRYAFRKLFFANGVSHLGTRIEDEKPLPYKVDMLRYSIADNKVYSLEADLPHDVIKESIISDEDKYDGILLTLAPYGEVVLYAYSSRGGGEPLKIAEFQAEEHSLSFEEFVNMGAMYGNFETTPKNWEDYQKNVLKTVFPEADAYLKKNGLPDKDFDFRSNENLNIRGD